MGRRLGMHGAMPYLRRLDAGGRPRSAGSVLGVSNRDEALPPFHGELQRDPSLGRRGEPVG